MATTHYIWDELSDNVLMEADEAGDAIATYTQEPGQFGELVSQHRNGVTSQYHFDGLGNTRQITDENENVTDEYTYSAFGEEVASSGTTVNPFGFHGSVGYQANPSTEDLYVRARHYRPSLGRWLSEDPQGLVDGPNVYGYVSNDPIDYIDPSGTTCADETGDCCCCADTILVPDGSKVPTSQGPHPTRNSIKDIPWGHHFDIHGHLIFYPSQKELPCKFEWWEYSTQPIGESGMKPGKWYDNYKAYGDRSTPNWNDWNRLKAKHSCHKDKGTFGTWNDSDEPVTNPATKLPQQGSIFNTLHQRDLFIKVIVRSASGCKQCKVKSRSICVHQRIKGKMKPDGTVVMDRAKSFLKPIHNNSNGVCLFNEGFRDKEPS